MDYKKQEKEIASKGLFKYAQALTGSLSAYKQKQGIDYVFHGITGTPEANIFNLPHCETDRFWKTQLAMTPERYWKHQQTLFDECRNAYIKPKAPQTINILDHLHKRSDYESGDIFANLPGMGTAEVEEE